ncbi:MAG: Uma2 family endonuclease [Deltaproteobacteria bacterium]|nr:Uma2 family endonuclease [Deltaproteobacteria bacterium]
MSSSPGPKRATYQDLLALPDNVVGEIVAGELVVSPRPAPAHATATSALGADLNQAFHRKPGGPKGPGGWWILDEPELHFHGDVLVPDLAGWRRERMAALPSTAAFELPPDWVCEVISPSSVRHDRMRKLPVYAREQVAWTWLVDPIARTLEVFRLDAAGHWVLLQVFGEDSGESVRVQPFEAIELDLARWWEGQAPG